jgi:voltage-gated potassium channel
MHEAPVLKAHGNAYSIFILILTLFSLALMVVQVLPISEETRSLVMLYDNVVCLIFLGDFASNLMGSSPKRAYFINARGWLDLLGSVPSFGFFQYAALLRLARLSRFARITRLLGAKSRGALVRDVLDNRGSYATFITILAAGMVLAVASILVLQFESVDPDSNIRTGGDALWWALTTITTVGYGDRFPVTLLGRTTGFFVMLAGVGIIGALASILASLLVAPPAEAEASGEADRAGDGTLPAATSAADAAILAELVNLRGEISALRAALPVDPTELPVSTPS